MRGRHHMRHDHVHRSRPLAPISIPLVRAPGPPRSLGLPVTSPSSGKTKGSAAFRLSVGASQRSLRGVGKGSRSSFWGPRLCDFGPLKRGLHGARVRCARSLRLQPGGLHETLHLKDRPPPPGLCPLQDDGLYTGHLGVHDIYQASNCFTFPLVRISVT